MSERFAPGAGRLAGLAGRALGWRPHEFWAATPAELAAILSPLAQAEAGTGVSRAEIARLMEQDND
ncbi:phage tail assembly chaperone [Novosphingobium flavum]|uniref:Phage tail assembly chaperone n=1 Tax=Novosphingobium flavum TaxID=1778672 RepID=A0A7X1FRI8_9SPHN|nr:phage tail assembly chaperone [Novosphingobium flavum]MBC2665047.1 phage tail assembly chaperone [Novosphingobium flavum]